MENPKKQTLIRITSKIVNFAFFLSIIFFVVYILLIFFISNPSRWTIEDYLKLLPLPLIAVYIIMILYYLRKIFKNFNLNIFFAPSNIKNIKSIGYMVLLYSALISFFKIYYLTQKPYSKFITIDYLTAIKFDMFFIGLIILVIAESFKKGEKIQTEQELTI